MIAEKMAESVASGFLKRLGDKLFDLLSKNVFEPRDLQQIVESHLTRTRNSVASVKILGMTQALPIEKIYYPTKVSESIQKRLYEGLSNELCNCG